MKKIIGLLMAGVMVAMLVTGCGEEAPNPTLENAGVENIIVEDIKVEEIRVEEIRVKTIDNEYNSELEYNSRVNTWDSGSNITYWD